MKANFFWNISVFFMVLIFLNTGCKNNESNSDQTVQISQTKLDSLNKLVSESNAASNSNSTQEYSNKFSLGDIRGQIIEGSKQEMIRIYGAPDEEYYAHDFLKKYFDFEPFSVYSAEFNIGQQVFIYHNIEINNKPILVLYYESKIISVKYLSDIRSYKDLSR